jgi:hypothetical protein
MPGQDLANALVKICTAQSAMSQYMAVIRGTLEDTVTLGSANDVPFYGFALNDATSGQTVGIHMAGGIAKAIAGASVTAMSFGVIESTDGRVKNGAITNTNANIVCQFLRDGVDGDVVPVLIVRGLFNLP